MRFIAIILLCLSVSVASLSAQSQGARLYEVAAGYQFMHDQDLAKQDPDLGANFPAGWLTMWTTRGRPFSNIEYSARQAFLLMVATSRHDAGSLWK